MKQAQDNPWQSFDATYTKGDKINVSIKSITDFGLFVGLPGGIDGLVHLADISWEKQSSEQLVSNFTKGQDIEVVVINIDAEKERISLGLKQLSEDGFTAFASSTKKGSIVNGVIAEVTPRGAVVTLSENITGYLKVSEISQERIEDASTVLKTGNDVEVVITQIDKRSRNIALSIKQKDSVEEKAAMADYNKQSDAATGSTLGDLLKKAKDK
jgi:small subunit ribosomal protein S1